jgi:SAM-dependent MidA family methyltransferase
LPERFCGVVIANEVLDAIPFERVCWTESGACLRGVGVGGAAIYPRATELGQSRAGVNSLER